MAVKAKRCQCMAACMRTLAGQSKGSCSRECGFTGMPLGTAPETLSLMRRPFLWP
jgi:hypothetical protein